MRLLKLIGTAALLSFAGAATAAQMFHLTYTTNVDAVSGPAVTFDATVTTDDGQFYGAPGYQVTSISGFRGSQAVSFDLTAFDDEIYYPGDASGKYVDNFGLDFMAGGTSYTLYRGSGDFAYHEFDGSTGRLVFDDSISLTPVVGGTVPEPAVWAMLLVGFAGLGSVMRRRRAMVAT